MKNLTLSLAFLLVAGMAISQETEKELKRPGAVGESGIDGFVGQSFDVYEPTLKTEKDLAAIEKELEKMENEGHKIKSDAEILKRLYHIQNEVKSRPDKIADLDNKAKDMLETAKNINPRTKAPTAIKAVNTATKALSISKDKTPGQAKKTEELISRANKLIEQ
jgi:uncharacterized protein YoxC